MRPPVPPFTRESAIQKVRMAEDAWSSRDPGRVSLAYSTDSRWRDAAGEWTRSYGIENWEFDAAGLMRARHASINDVPIDARDRLLLWADGPRPAEHPGLTELGL